MPDPIYYNDPDIGTFQYMYDTTGTLQKVKETMVSNRTAQGWTANLPSVVVTGTAISGGVLESEIVAGGETLIFTLTNGTWAATVVDDLLTITAAVFVNGSVAGGTGWDEQVGFELGTGDIARTSDVVVTITTPEASNYAISGDETVTFAIPYSLVQVNGVPLTSTASMTCSPANFVITNEA